MFKGIPNSTNFDEEAEEGELQTSPPQEYVPDIECMQVVSKETDIHIDEGILIDRTETYKYVDYHPDDCTNPMNASDWSSNFKKSLLDINDTSETGGEDEPSAKRPKMISCFNCGGDHQLNSCPEPRDSRRISKNAAEFKERKRLSEVNRYHQDDTSMKDKRFTPGRISDNLRRALGIGPDDIPEWIYRMRKKGLIKGYPPGYLRQALEREEIPDEVLKFHLVDDEIPETFKKDDEKIHQRPPKLNEMKIYYYMGFNNTYRRIHDRERNFRIPPFREFCRLYQEELDKKFWEDREEFERIEKYEKRETEQEIKELTEEGDIIVLPPPKSPEEDNDNDGDNSFIIMDNLPMDQQPLEEAVEEDIKDENVDGGSSYKEPNQSSVTYGTPVIVRQSNEGQYMKPNLPTLEAFSKGITPFRAQEEPTPHRGFLKRFYSKLKKVTHSK